MAYHGKILGIDRTDDGQGVILRVVALHSDYHLTELVRAHLLAYIRPLHHVQPQFRRKLTRFGDGHHLIYVICTLGEDIVLILLPLVLICVQTLVGHVYLQSVVLVEDIRAEVCWRVVTHMYLVQRGTSCEGLVVDLIDILWQGDAQERRAVGEGSLVYGAHRRWQQDVVQQRTAIKPTLTYSLQAHVLEQLEVGKGTYLVFLRSKLTIEP